MPLHAPPQLIGVPKPVRSLLCLFSLILAACTPPDPRVPTRTTPTPVPCPTAKIAFTQAEGCLNDGSVEFCLPASDSVALSTVEHIAPDVTCVRAGGRARCDTTTEILCLLPTYCSSYDSALTDSGWRAVCDLAALPFIHRIVPTWYE